MRDRINGTLLHGALIGEALLAYPILGKRAPGPLVATMQYIAFRQDNGALRRVHQLVHRPGRAVRADAILATARDVAEKTTRNPLHDIYR